MAVTYLWGAAAFWITTPYGLKGGAKLFRPQDESCRQYVPPRR
jgi:hypothetical protein